MLAHNRSLSGKCYWVSKAGAVSTTDGLERDLSIIVSSLKLGCCYTAGGRTAALTMISIQLYQLIISDNEITVDDNAVFNTCLKYWSTSNWTCWEQDMNVTETIQCCKFFSSNWLLTEKLNLHLQLDDCARCCRIPHGEGEEVRSWKGATLNRAAYTWRCCSSILLNATSTLCTF